MPDINKCMGKDCTKRVNCYRYRALSNPERQSFYRDSPINIKTQKCDRYLQIINHGKLKLNDKTT